jgi:hypothetical protein
VFEATVSGGSILPAGTLQLAVFPNGTSVTINGTFTGNAGESAILTGTLTLAGNVLTGTVDISGDINASGLTFSGKLNGKKTKLKMELTDAFGAKRKLKAGPLPGGAFLMATVDGAPWVADPGTEAADWNTNYRQLQVSGYHFFPDGSINGVALGILDTGLNFPYEFQLGEQSQRVGSGIYTEASAYSTVQTWRTDATHTGTLTICSFNPKKGRISGTFSFDSTPLFFEGPPVSVLGGSFSLAVHVPK